jgi:predicted nucleic acid-binding protein
MNAVDTNVLLYAHDPRDPSKQRAALEILATLDEGALLWQVACEFLSASRKLEPMGYNREHAWSEVERLQGIWSTVYPSRETLETAQRLLTRFSLSFWDAMILAACITGGVNKLYTEDFGGYPEVEGVRVVNPFRSPA